MEEDLQQFENEETHNAEDEPEEIIETDQMRANLNYLIVNYQYTQNWTENTWWRMRETHRYRWYQHYWRAIRHMGRRGPHIIPFDGNDFSDVRYAAYPQHAPVSHLLDRTIRRHRVREGILEVEIYQIVQSRANRRINYESRIWGMNPEERRRRRMDERGFPQDRYQGRHTYDPYTPGLLIGWYPMIQLLHTTPDVVMTYFLRMRPMEHTRDPNWHLWSICYDMIRHEESLRPAINRWRYLDHAVDMSDTENEDIIETDSDDTIS
jgi:hypothetical protein